jgi:DNA-binding PadR family transcriptional regulator
VLLSPGTIYPLLHSLEEKGLLTSKKNGKAKTYVPAEDAELRIRSLLDEHIQARKLLNHYLQQETTSIERGH